MQTELATASWQRKLARRAPRAARAVGNALRSNPAMIVIPCHRVVRSDGRVGGYDGRDSEQRKTQLLELELSGLGASA